MPPRGSESLDITPILTHYVFLATSILSIIGWFTAFISQIVATSRSGRAAVGVLWFAIFLQLFLILGVFYTLASDSISMHRMQISIFGVAALVFSIFGVDLGIFTHDGARSAMSAGWLILAIVNIIWLLFFTSEDDSFIFYVFNSFGTGGLTPPSRRRRSPRGGSVHNMATNNGYATNYASGGGIGSNDIPYDMKMGGGAPGMGMGGGAPGMGMGMGVGMGMGGVSPGVAAQRSQHSLTGASPAVQANRSLGAVSGAGGSTGNVNSGLGMGMGSNGMLEPTSPLMGGGAAGLGAGGGAGSTSAADSTQTPETYSYKAKALYSYTASADDPNEISFTKGELLDIVDKQGKWWQAKKEDGTTGIAPSNYLQLI